ncbi:acyltransferase domain-containing protein [Streptomyces sp. H27-D2]|uniref:acyltransferase domain-containing protein n=1 Tax=Streptomyces sp. H27-D2 TaxID=3046304 RepID=UPI002DB7D87E|nr:acyltransferase domain-containing protein [Streptomyces sp. H27-D2]MEC4020689.1 acyltransferase domain-containing protein [Streptomyces sp. H27-D2]
MRHSRVTADRAAPTVPGIVHLFPGQGDFPISPLVRLTRPGGALRRAAVAVFEQVDQVALEHGALPLSPWLFGDRAPSGRDLDRATIGTAQLAVFGASMAIHQALREASGEPDTVLGISFGEIASLTAAGVYSIGDGARIAYDLAVVLASCPGGMSFLACAEPVAAQLLDRPETRNVVVACVNDSGATVVSGPVAELAALEEHAAARKVTAARLRLPFSSHHPALVRQAETFAAAVRAYSARQAGCVVYSAVAGRAYTPADDLPRRLADCLIRPVRLPQVLLQAAQQRPTTFFEAGTGSALAQSAHRVLADRPVTVHAPLAEAFAWRSA